MNWHKKFVDKKLKFFSFIKGVIITCLLFLFFDHYKISNDNEVKFEIDYSNKFQENGFDGRVLLMISNNNYSEPRFQINDNHNTQMIFGVDVNSWNSNKKIIIDAEAFGYPIESINDIKEGEYYVQALLHK